MTVPPQELAVHLHDMPDLISKLCSVSLQVKPQYYVCALIDN